MAITAADVKKLRDATGAGMMDAKKALDQANGDFEAAVELLRVSGAAKVAKRDDREASNGLVATAGTTLIHFGTETDFVAKNEEVTTLAQQIAEAADAAAAADVAAALGVKLESGQTVEEAIADLAAKTGEKLELANLAHFKAPVNVYLHRRNPDLPPQVGVMVEYEGGTAEFMRGISQQIAAMRPQWVTSADVPADVIEKERHVAELTAKEEGKPEKIIPRIVEGRLQGFYKDVCLVDQASVLEDKKSVGQLLKENGATVSRFVRFQAGA